ncbi:MAG: hypothetical protein OEY34_05130 [Cyclobacteriaceae bacterium]|nr:hypothetical protein [Cyclobacteriaceae bacterium]
MNGRAAGYMKSISVNIQNNVRPVKAIGYRKPRGLKSLDWAGTADGEFHVLVAEEEGVIPIDTHDDAKADDLFGILIIHKTTGKRIGQLTGAVQTEGFDITNNDFTGRRVSFELMDWEPMEGYH